MGGGDDEFDVEALLARKEMIKRGTGGVVTHYLIKWEGKLVWYGTDGGWGTALIKTYSIASECHGSDIHVAQATRIPKIRGNPRRTSRRIS